MTNTVNFTASVDRDLLKRAKLIAAQSDTSVNVLFNAEMRRLVRAPPFRQFPDFERSHGFRLACEGAKNDAT